MPRPIVRRPTRRAPRWTGFLPAAALALLAVAAAVPAAALWPGLCLPPVYEGGRRLHQLPSPRVFWLELALRQHEICWRRPPRPETRIAMLGSSAVFGLPLPVEETLGERLNERLAADAVPAHVFNLAWANPYQLRDAVILHEILPLRPDVVVYPLTLAEFVHTAPILFPTLTPFFTTNVPQLAALIAASPPGLSEPLAIYDRKVVQRPDPWRVWHYLREIGRFVRVAANGSAHALLPRLVPGAPPPQFRTRGRQTDYDCAETAKRIRRNYANFAEWSVLPYLQQLQEEQGIAVLVVNWPIAHEPLGDCYSVRFTSAIVAEFNDWLREQTAARGLAYLDLHDALPPEAFLDSLHLTADGHAAVSERLYPALLPLLDRRQP